MANPTPASRAINPILLPEMRDLEYGLQEWLKLVRPLLKGGFISKSVAGNVDTTLNLDESQTEIVELTGAITGNINVIVPTKYWQWTFKNGTSGAHTVTIKTSAGTGIVVATGKRAILYCDGTNVVRVTADT